MLEMYRKTAENSVEYVVGENDRDAVTENGSDVTTTSSSETSESSDHEETTRRPPIKNGVNCSKCGRGPFRSVKRHLLYCHGVKEKFQCVLCKHFFFTKETLQQHHMPLYLCHSCGQVLPTKKSFSFHSCPRGVGSTLVLFCSESMPKVCSICKSFFSSDKALSIHLTKVHSSKVCTKHWVVAGSSSLTKAKSEQKQAFNSSLCSSQACVDLTGPETRDSGLVASSTLSILALFENESRQWALTKRLNTGWRSKAPCPCRQCGAVFRQPSFAISHRYLHRGQRTHHCQCGRAFRRQLHLLRHCVQHAESSSYVCVNCGYTFLGATLLTRHLTCKPFRGSRRGRTVKERESKKCRMPLMCDCGLAFSRPSAYIWHQLKNRTKTKKLQRN